MERNSEIKTLSFTKGMTNVPSDLLCDDSELLECEGFVTKSGSLVPVQNPKKILSIPYKLQYVHKGADYKNFIAYDEASKKLYCYICGENAVGDILNTQFFGIGSLLDVKSVGNTLLCATENGIHYLLYKGNEYKDLGTELPKPSVKFMTGSTNVWIGGGTACNISSFVDSSPKIAVYDANGKLSEIRDNGTTDNFDGLYWKYYIKNDSTNKPNFENAVQGHVAERIRLLKERNYFMFPFFVRYALKLYDGSYARISNPILILPSINRNGKFTPYRRDDKDGFVESIYSKKEGPTYFPAGYFIWSPIYSKLYYNAVVPDLDRWEDIVKEVVVFATDDVMPFSYDDKWDFKSALETDGQCYSNFVARPNKSGIGLSDSLYDNNYYSFSKDGYRARDVIMPSYKTDGEIIDELLSKTQFYKLFSLDIYDDNIKKAEDNNYVVAPIKKNVVVNLTTQEQLGKDDYYGWCKISAKKMFPYNKRINVFDIERIPFEGFNFFIPVTNSTSILGFTHDDIGYYDVYVHIVSENTDCWVMANGTYTACPEMLTSWFYYPDTNATEMMVVKQGTTKGKLLKLKKHPMLNGSYYFKDLPFPRVSYEKYEYDNLTLPEVKKATESLNSQIFTSVVNNPFVFEASGDNTVGTGKILGIISNTDAVSQGQFGQYPLLVFTDEGIYGMSVNSEGLYSATYPISREAATDNSPFVPTDSLVFFASKKGLMAVSGGTVACMSEQLRGKISNASLSKYMNVPFVEFISDCMIAYDYRDSLLRIYNPKYDYQYIYNMADKTFSICQGKTSQAVVNDYPDNLIQDTDGNVYSLTEKPDINNDENDYNGTIITRPLKLGGSMTLKSLRAIKNLRDTEDGKLSLEIWTSNDCKHWCQLHSLGGKPWKYFVFRYNLKDFKASDSFAGSIVRVQNRRQDKIR